MREIEVKTKLRDPEGFLAAAEKLGIKFGKPVEQEDVTFLNGTPKDDPNWTIIRLRKHKGKNVLTIKFKASDRSRDNHEHETEVSDPGEMRKIIERLGYSENVAFSKTRRFANYQGYEVCFDDLHGIGWFAEMEKLAPDDADVDAIQVEMWGIMKQLGVSDEDRIHKSYNQLASEHQAKQSGITA